MDEQLLQMVFDPNNLDTFFKHLEVLAKTWNRNLKVILSPKALELLKERANNVFEREEFQKITFKIPTKNREDAKDKETKNKREMVDLVCNKERVIIELSFGPLSDKRKVYRPYPKNVSWILYVIVKEESKVEI